MSVIVFLSGGVTNVHSQDISFEEVKKICKSDIPREDRIRVSVIRFSSRMRTLNSNNLGTELATMLTNALYEVNCFRVLESASNLNDFNAEYNLNNDGYTDASGSSKGKMLGAQVIITGEITEYGEGKQTFGAFGVSVGRQKANVGFVLKVLDVNTREVLYSQSINMEGKASGFSGAQIMGLKMVGTTDRSKALNNAVEKAIIKAAEVLAKSKDEWGIESNAESLNRNKTIRVNVTGIGFGEVVSFASRLKSIDSVTKVSKSFKNGAGIFSVVTSLSGEDLAFAILEAVGIKYEITEVDNGTIKLKKN